MDPLVKALIIDDEEMVRSGLRDFFEVIGYQVVDAADGQQGLEAFRRERPHIIFTDLRMPVLDGYAVIETVQRESPDTPIIAISGTSALEDATRAMRIGAWAYVMKPIQAMGDLEAVASKSLKQARQVREATTYRVLLEEQVRERTADLSDSEARYRTLFESATDAILLLHQEKIDTCNRKALDLFGCTQADISNRSLLSLSPLLQPDGSYSAETLSRYVSDALAGEPQFYDWKHARHNGELFDAEVSLNSVDLRGKIFLQAVVRDITTRKQQNALILTLSAAVTQSANMIIIADPEGRIMYVNPKYCDISGITADKVIGRTLAVLQSDLPSSASYDTIWKTISSGRVWRGELGNRRQNKDVFWVSATIAPVRDTSGAVSNFIAVMEDVTERKRDAERLYQQANYDTLTGLPNRFLLAELLLREVEKAQEKAGGLCLLLLNIDNLKYINDTLGHAQGDELLRQLSDRLRALLCDGEIIARFTGDEFVLVKRLSEPGKANEIAHRIHAMMESPFQIAHTDLFITVSIGAVTCPEDGESAEGLLRNAEAAMFAARKFGRPLQFFTSEISAQANERLSRASRLRKALDRNEYVLYFQPQVELATRTVTSAETLLRWTPTNEEMMLPARFVPVLEETGLIVPVGEWALRQSCRQIREWLDAGHPSTQIAVNISAWQFRGGRLIETVRTSLDEFGLPPSCLCLELTESIVMHDVDDAIKTLHSLATMGIRLSIDDFGTGYSSLSYLRRMPIHELKIDRSFVMNVPHDANSAAIVNTILSMAQAMNLEVVAEGVENEEQLKFLAERNCHKIQGYYFGKPLPAEQLPETIRNWNRILRRDSAA